MAGKKAGGSAPKPRKRPTVPGLKKGQKVSIDKRSAMYKGKTRT
jgi:hypothetical protein